MVVHKQKDKTSRFNLWVMARQFSGYPKRSDFAKEERDVPDLAEGEYLVEAIAWGVDPFNRTYADSAAEKDFGEGYCIVGFQLAKVIASKTAEFKVGDLVVGQFGWRTQTVVKTNDPNAHSTPLPIANFSPYRLAELPVEFGPKLPETYSVGVLGLTGVTAFYSIIDACRVRPGDTLVVNAAAGAVGSIACQIAKIKGCKVIGIVGSDEKAGWLKSIGIDCAVNYNSKKFDLHKTLSETAPDGVDAFLDLVGGDSAIQVYNHLRVGGRVCQAGNISAYNAPEKPKLPDFFDQLVRKELTIVGFNVAAYAARLKSACGQLAKWIAEGKLHVRETIHYGFDQLPAALIDLLDGKNIGKVVVLKAVN